MKFLVVDDENINLIITRHLLEHILKVKDIKTYQKAGEALRFLESYDGLETVSVFLDLNMPVISGFDFLEFFSEFNENLKGRVHIYVVSSSVDPADKKRALSNPNVISFVSKPLTIAFIQENFCNIGT